jgi:hypothetical protein
MPSHSVILTLVQCSRVPIKEIPVTYCATEPMTYLKPIRAHQYAFWCWLNRRRTWRAGTVTTHYFTR